MTCILRADLKCYRLINGHFPPQFSAIPPFPKPMQTRTMATMKNRLILLFLLLNALPSWATTQEHAALRTLVANFIQQQTAGLPGKVSFNVDEIDRRISLRSCERIEVFLPAGSQLIGRVSVGVRCAETNGWSTFIPVQIKISRELIVSSRPLALGQVVHEEDLARQTTETTQNIGITDSRLVVGKVLRFSVAAGYMLREEMLRPPYSVKQGQVVSLSIQGGGFSLNSSGVALSNAAEGEHIQVRTQSGRVVSGIAGEDGTVKISP